MKSALRTLLAVVAGMVVAFALVVAVELFSSVVHPFPPGLDPNAPGSIAEQVRRHPGWVLAVAGLMWGATAAAATWVSSRIGGRLPAAFFVACLLGVRYGGRAPSAPARGDPARRS